MRSNDPSPYYRPQALGQSQRPRRVRWIAVGVTAAFVAAAVLVLLILLFPSAFGLASASYPPGYGVFGLFFILIVGFFIVRVIFWGTRASRNGSRSAAGYPGRYGPDRPAMVARMRYARGEISREQYEQIMRDLGRPPGAP